MTQTTLALCLAMSFAGGVETTAQQATSAHADSITLVTLGQSAVPLYGPWKFTVGDSPIDPKTGTPLWAEPDFDDSKWETVDLTPKDGAIDPITGLPGYVPGWTAKGHPGYFGYAWYRIRVEVEARQGAELALAGPADVDDGYQVFDDGELAGQFGNFTGSKPIVYFNQPKMFPLAQARSRETGTGQERTGQDRTGQDGARPDGSSQAERTQVLAFRLWMEPNTLNIAPDAGGMHSAPVLGEAGAVAASYQIRWLELIRSQASYVGPALLFGLLAVVAFTLILFDRSDRVYLWMGALFLLIAAYATLEVIVDWTEVLSVSMGNLLVEPVAALIWAAWVMVFWVWFGLQRPPWLPRLSAALALLLMISYILGDEVFFALVPHEVALHFETVSLVIRLLFFALMLWVVVEGIRRQGVEGWLVLPVVALRGINAFSVQLSLLHIRMYWFPFGTQIGLGAIANLLVAVVIALLLLRRLFNR